MAVASYVGASLGSLAASPLLQVTSPWVPILISVAASMLGASPVYFISETLHRKRSRDNSAATRLHPKRSVVTRAGALIQLALARFQNIVTVFPCVSAFLVLLVFLCQAPVSQAAGPLFLQYISKRFSWSMAKTGYLLSIRGMTSILVLLVGLPCLGQRLTSLPINLSPLRKDLVLAQLSTLMLVAGALLLALSSTVGFSIIGLILMTLGDGLISLCRSVITSLVNAENLSTICTLVSIMETVGALFAGPVLASLFSRGMMHGGLGQGLPYFALASLGIGALILLVSVKLPQESNVCETQALLSGEDELGQ